MPGVVGIDLSLTSTGLAIIQRGTVTVSRVASSGTQRDTLLQRRRRLVAIEAKVVGLVQTTMPDLVVIEAPSFASRHGHPHDRSGLWWLVVDSIMRTGAPVAAVPPSCRAKYATGKGNAPKDLVLTDVVRRYTDIAGAAITKNDEADALVLAAMGMRRLGAPIDVVPVTHLKGMDGVEWP